MAWGKWVCSEADTGCRSSRRHRAVMPLPPPRRKDSLHIVIPHRSAAPFQPPLASASGRVRIRSRPHPLASASARVRILILAIAQLWS